MVSSIEGNIRYLKSGINKEIWRKSRAAAINKGQTITQWMEEAAIEKIEREKNENNSDNTGI